MGAWRNTLLPVEKYTQTDVFYGFTLIESLLATVVLSISLVAIFNAITHGQTRAYQALHETQVTFLAESLIEEIMSLPYTDTGGSANNRGFNDISDYNGYDEEASEGQVVDLQGNPYPEEYQTYERHITVTPISLNLFGVNQNGLRVSVTVIYTSNGNTWLFTRDVPEPAP